MNFFDRFKKKGNTPLQGAPTDHSVVDDEKQEDVKKASVEKEQPEVKKETKEAADVEKVEKKPVKQKEKLSEKVQKKRDQIMEKQKDLKKGVKKEKVEEKRKLTDTKNAHRILLQPVITEKATVTGTYVFEVHPDTNKKEISKAIFRVYGVTPKHVRIINVKGKSVRWGQQRGSQKSWKKAVVRLPEGEVINVYEGT